MDKPTLFPASDEGGSQPRKPAADWYSHPDFIGRTRGRVGGGLCSCGCALFIALLLASSVIIGLVYLLLSMQS